MSPHGATGDLDGALILAPYRRDADYLIDLLARHDIDATRCTPADVAAGLETSGGVLVATHEALSAEVVAQVGGYLAMQARWSELPIVVLLDRASPSQRTRAQLGAAWPRARLLFYERPVAPVELLSGIQAALLARRRQIDIRDHMVRELELRRELNHRVKNILASVVSIFQMTRRAAQSVDQLDQDFTGRLAALATVHSAVFQSDGERIAVRDIVDLTFDPYDLAKNGRLVVGGPDIVLSREAGTTLALCLHELTTNAIKYGALSTTGGRISFTWTLDQGQWSIAWHEAGGPAVAIPLRPGYGTRYLRSALKSLFGRAPQIEFDPAGVRCTVFGDVERVQGDGDEIAASERE